MADLSQELSGLQNDLSEVAPLALAEANRWGGTFN